MEQVSAHAPGRVLVVCTANVCRSPMTELLLRAGLALRRPEVAGEVQIGSAGVRAREGQAIAEYAAELLAERGIASDDFASRALVPALVVDADLVLCASREHKSAVVTLVPEARSRTFTIREFAWLLGTEPVPDSENDLGTRLRRLVATAASRRGLRQPERQEDFDLDDPFGRRKAAFRKTLALLDETLTGPLDLLAQRSAGSLVPAATRRSRWRS